MNESRKLKTSLLLLESYKPIIEDSSKLRGYIANKFPEYPFFHNHIGDKYLYTYPRIQYKIINHKAYILGIEEGAELIKMIDVDELILGDNTYSVQKTFYDKEEKIIPTKEFQQYEFMTPWIALNQKNYNAFINIKNWKEKKIMLNKILVGNIISLCKGFNFDIERYIHVQSKLKLSESIYKNIHRLSFVGNIRINMIIPDYFGIGGKVSSGFGVIKRV